MITRIRGWNKRKISYAGRLVLVKSVLAKVHTYWSQLFVLPMGVMDRIQALCRNFLWEGEDTYSKAPLVAWSVLCKDKKVGGMSQTNSRSWNIAAIGKLACSWAWRKVCEVKTKFMGAYATNQWQDISNPYTIAKGYRWLTQNDDVRVNWYGMTWNRFNTPKHCFIIWLMHKDRLLTLDRLLKMGICLKSLCYLCGVKDESLWHLTSECSYTKVCYQLMQDWIGVKVSGLQSGVVIMKERSQSMLIRLLKNAAIVGMFYHIWMIRNTCRLQHYVPRPAKVIHDVQREVKLWFQAVFDGQLKPYDLKWCRNHQLI
ncbi:uncharacterized protein LOC141595215 [Silene latifolia]|uniref:uncharacterized protein LOC141595215 n=1 Tax=Silene latifolia TaxID=37657 RepID=UPI003D774E93